MAIITPAVVFLILLLAARHALAGPPAQQGTPQTQAAAAAPLGASFTYQGRLLDGANPATGSYDLLFRLYDAPTGGTQLGSTLSRDDVILSNGLFTVELDFSSGVFTGDGRWLEIALRPGSSTGDYTTVTPSLPLTAVPYALGLRPGASVSSATSNVLNLSTSATAGVALNATASAATGNAAAVLGSSSSPGGAGLSGYNSSSGGYGVYGTAAGGTGAPYGVYGLASHAGSATSYGVFGKSNSSVGTGVGGEAPMKGVLGKATGSNGYGVYGEATTASGTAYGVYGKASSLNGHGVYGEGGYYGVYGVGTDPAGLTYGIYGASSGTNGYGVLGQSTYRHGVRGASTNGVGVYGTASTTGTVGIATGSSGPTWGLYGQSNAASGYGVYGENTSAGTTYGVYGVNASSSGAGVMGTSKNAAGAGVRGETVSGHGVEGVVDWTRQGAGVGVHGSGGFYGYGASFENLTTMTPTVLIENQNYASGGPALEVWGTTVITGNTHVNGDLTWKPRTGYVSISPAAFQPPDNDELYEQLGHTVSRNRWQPTDLVNFVADAQLPHGATVTRFTVYWSLLISYPPTPATFSLVRSDLAMESLPVMATVASWSDDDNVLFSSSTTSISDPVVRNDVNIYFVKAAMPGAVRLHAVIIEYQVSEPY
jgi:hypothetical protein